MYPPVAAVTGRWTLMERRPFFTISISEAWTKLENKRLLDQMEEID